MVQAETAKVAQADVPQQGGEIPEHIPADITRDWGASVPGIRGAQMPGKELNSFKVVSTLFSDPTTVRVQYCTSRTNERVVVFVDTHGRGARALTVDSISGASS